MKSRREFLKSMATAGAAVAASASTTKPVRQDGMPVAARVSDRSYWLAIMRKIAGTVLENLARRELKKTMPIEAANPTERAKYTHLARRANLSAAGGDHARSASSDATHGGVEERRLDRYRHAGEPTARGSSGARCNACGASSDRRVGEEVSLV